MPVLPPPESEFEVVTGTLIVGTGAGGMIAALSAHEKGEGRERP